MSDELVVGLHSIMEALRNEERTGKKLYATKEAWNKIKNSFREHNFEIEVFENLDIFNRETNKILKKHEAKQTRVANGLLLETSFRRVERNDELFQKIKDGEKLKIICLDQVTDLHNMAAVARTAAFYGVDYVVVPSKKTTGLTPSFYRISSGAAEHVVIKQVGNLSKFIRKCDELGAYCVGFSEHATMDTSSLVDSERTTLLVLGNEELGISHAVKRVLTNYIALKPQGKIKSLNVSVAAAVSMEKIFGPC